MLEVAEADLEPGFVRPQACRKLLAERVDANDRAFRASRWRRGSVARARCTDLTVEGDRGVESTSLRHSLTRPGPYPSLESGEVLEFPWSYVLTRPSPSATIRLLRMGIKMGVGGLA